MLDNPCTPVPPAVTNENPPRQLLRLARIGFDPAPRES